MVQEFRKHKNGKSYPIAQSSIRRGAVPTFKEESFKVLTDTGTKNFREDIPSARKFVELQLIPYTDQKVTVVEENEGLSGMTYREHQGKIVRIPDGRLAFMEKGQRSRGKIASTGLFDGFAGVITIRKIKLGW